MKSLVAIHRRHIAGVAVLFVALAVTAVTADTAIWSSRVLSTSENTVATTFTNVSKQPFSGWVQVQAVVGDAPIWSCASVSAKPGQTVTVPVNFPGKVQSVLSVGISDDPTPL